MYTAIVHFKCPTSPLVSLLLRITALQASLVAAMRAGLFLEDQHRTRSRRFPLTTVRYHPYAIQ